MKGKNNKNNDNNKACKPVISEETLNSEVLEASETAPDNNFLETPVSAPQKGVK